MQSQFFFFFPLNLLIGYRCRTIVGYCRTKNTCISIREMSLRCFVHFFSRFDIDTDDTRMLRFELHRACNQGHLCSATGTFFCQRESHLSGRIIADETHRVNLFVSRSGGNHHFLSGQFVTRSKEFIQYPDDILRLFHSPLPYQMAG